VIIIVVGLTVTGAAAATANNTADFGGDGTGCPTMKNGGVFTIKVGQQPFRGSSYDVGGFHTTCALAFSWVRRLSRLPYTGPNKALPAPKGWRCWSDKKPLLGAYLAPRTVLQGVCQDNAKIRSFFWNPSISDAKPVAP
jgi:hypothetical protein